MSNHITVRGRVGTDPELFITAAGTELTTFRLATTPSHRDSTTGEWRDGRTEWFTVKVWGNLGPNVRASVRIGIPVIVLGRFASEEWEHAQTGTMRYRLTITASAVGVDVRQGEVRYTKMSREIPVTDVDIDVDEDRPGQAGPGPVADEAGDHGTAEDGAEDRFAPELVDPGEWEKTGGPVPAS